MAIVGTIRTLYDWVGDIAHSNTQSITPDIVRDGDRYAFYLDGLVVNIDAYTGAESAFAITFSAYPETGIEEKLLVDFPYSCRGTRNNPHYIPLGKDTGLPVLPVNRKFYYKLANGDGAQDATGVAFVIMGYPVLAEEI